MAQESLLNTNWNSGDEIAATELNTHGQEHLDLDGHGDAFHAVQYLKSLAGGNGIDPNSIGDGDTLSVTWSDASDLTSGGDIGTGVVSEPELNVDPFIYDPVTVLIQVSNSTGSTINAAPRVQGYITGV